LSREYDASFGNVPEYLAAWFSSVAHAPWTVCRSSGRELLGAAVDHDSELVVVVGRAPDRAAVAADLLGRVDAPRSATTCWLAADDLDVAGELARRGFHADYTDVQMRRPTVGLTDRSTPMPDGFRIRDGFAGETPALHEIHDLICIAWGVEPDFPGFVDRFAGSDDFEPGLWILADDHDGLAGAVLARREQTADSPVVLLTHVDVHPRARDRGLARAMLAEVCRRAAEVGFETAQLGVHEDNASHAFARYLRLGWAPVSRRTKWSREGVSHGSSTDSFGLSKPMQPRRRGA
jgi:ribosomal protein S18 acetylase RimI-like enzyme